MWSKNNFLKTIITQLIVWSPTTERTFTDKIGENGITTDGKNDEDHDGIQMIMIYILLGVAIVILAAILCVVLKIMKKRRITTENIAEENENYGRSSDPEQYYEEEKNAKIVDTNDYY